MIGTISILVSLIFFVNKILVLVGKKTGWLVGAFAAVLAVTYFFLLKLYIFTVLEFGLVILMGYGYWAKEETNSSVEKLIQKLILTIMTILAIFAFTGMMTVYEFTGAILMLLGTYYLTHRKEAVGWLLYGISHLFAAYVTNQKGQQFFADFQIASAVVSGIGFMLTTMKKKE